MRITVFTPTYNRAYIIEKLYRSLQSQTFRDFEWVVIDDGSLDNTQELFAQFMSEPNDFSIRYERVENGGKHRAINRGVEMAQGELFFIVDSDDHLTNTALETINKIEASINPDEKAHFCGICGQRGTDSQNALGTTFLGDIRDITTLDRGKHHIYGDKAEVFYTALLKEYPFPTFDNEKFLVESVVWDRMGADGYLLRFFNIIIIVCNYLQDGLTAQGKDLYYKNPKGYGLHLSQLINNKQLIGRKKWYTLLDYYGALRSHICFADIAQYLHMHPLYLWLGLFLIRVRNKLFSHHLSA